MGYELRKRKKKDGTENWLLYFRSIKDGVKTDTYIPKNALIQHGFHPTMDVEDAKARVSQLNGLKRIERREEGRKVRILAQARERAEIKSAHLPPRLVDEFENRFLKEQLGIGANGFTKYQKGLHHWAWAKRMIEALNIPPEEWKFRSRAFYDYFRKQAISYEYSRKVLRVLNLWGVFVSHRVGTSFLEVSTPGKVDREAINDAWHDKGNTSTASLPLAPSVLDGAKDKFKPPQYQWLFVSVWLGLRPNEIDNLLKPGAYRIEKDSAGVEVIWVYQPKLTALPRADRFKGIPCILPEQRTALEYIQTGQLKRPIVKTMHRYLGPGINTYGGRKGFSDLMLAYGQDITDISMWMGHQDITTTWIKYKQKKLVKYKKPA